MKLTHSLVPIVSRNIPMHRYYENCCRKNRRGKDLKLTRISPIDLEHLGQAHSPLQLSNAIDHSKTPFETPSSSNCAKHVHATYRCSQNRALNFPARKWTPWKSRWTMTHAYSKGWSAKVGENRRGKRERRSCHVNWGITAKWNCRERLI